MQAAEIPAPGLDEPRQLLQLRHAHRGLHVRQLQVITDVRVCVLVVIAARQVAHLPFKPLAARVVFAWVAPAVPSPVPERLDQHL